MDLHFLIWLDTLSHSLTCWHSANPIIDCSKQSKLSPSSSDSSGCFLWEDAFISTPDNFYSFITLWPIMNEMPVPFLLGFCGETEKIISWGNEGWKPWQGGRQVCREALEKVGRGRDIRDWCQKQGTEWWQHLLPSLKGLLRGLRLFSK